MGRSAENHREYIYFLHHVSQHCPTGCETTPPYALRSSRFGSEPPSVDDDVDVWRYAILELHVRNDDDAGYAQHSMQWKHDVFTMSRCPVESITHTRCCRRAVFSCLFSIFVCSLLPENVSVLVCVCSGLVVKQVTERFESQVVHCSGLGNE